MLRTLVRRTLPVFVLSAALALACAACAGNAPTPAPPQPLPAYCVPLGNVPMLVPPSGLEPVSADHKPDCPAGSQPYVYDDHARRPGLTPASSPGADKGRSP
jgi:hypothetical protein